MEEETEVGGTRKHLKVMTDRMGSNRNKWNLVIKAGECKKVLWAALNHSHSSVKLASSS